MGELHYFMSSWGYPALVLLGFAEFAGLPVTSVPLLLGVGAIGATGTLNPILIVVSVVSGGFLADALWFTASRARGARVVNAACSVSANPAVCVLGVMQRIEDVGPLFLVFGKFVPGVSAMLSSAAGLSRIPKATFYTVDAAALLVWASTYVGLGWLFADRVTMILEWIVQHLALVAVAVGLGLLGAVMARLGKIRSHGALHRAGPVDRGAGPADQQISVTLQDV